LLAGCCYGKVTEAWWGIHLHGQYRHPTQILEALSLIILGFILIRIKHIPLVLASYLAGYGLIRFMIEILRGDLLRGSWAWGLTPSQWVSILLIFSGVSIKIADRLLSAKTK
jgi:phosphatidylglycerol:prolipoprotein diacylglycerol transferase